MKAKLSHFVRRYAATLLLVCFTAQSSSIEQLQAASMQSTALQSQLESLLAESTPDNKLISSLRRKIQKSKSREVALYQALVTLKSESDYSKALASQDIIVEGMSECERIESDKECILKAEQAALALAAKQGGHYFIEANSEQNNQREQIKGKIKTSVQFNETVSMKVKAHVLGFTTLEKNIERNAFSSNRHAVVKLKAQVAGQQNTALKKSLQAQAQSFYKPYLSSNELIKVSQFNLIQLAGFGVELVEIPKGSFKLGSLKGDRNEYPETMVSVNTFYMSRLEISKDVYNQCIKALVCSREPYTGDVSEPAVEVSWHEINDEFIPWLSNLTGYQLRMPSEQEWEYVAKKGRGTAQLCTVANGNFKFSDCNDDFDELAPVGMLKANRFGLYDLQGNAAEWTNSCWRYDHSARSRALCNKAVVKGGSWYNNAHYLRPSARFGKSKGTKLDTLGFRLAL